MNWLDPSIAAGKVQRHVWTRHRLPVKWENHKADTPASFHKRIFPSSNIVGGYIGMFCEKFDTILNVKRNQICKSNL